MLDKTRSLIDTLRHCQETGARCGTCPSGCNEKGIPKCVTMGHLADVIEEISSRNMDLMAGIQRYRKEWNKAQALLEQVTRERDAAVSYLHGDCYCCAYRCTTKCMNCIYEGALDGEDWWEWEGVEE